MGGNRKTSSGGVAENDVARSVLIMIDTQAARDHFQILDPPIARIALHLATSFVAFDTGTWYHVRYHFRLYVGVSILSSVPLNVHVRNRGRRISSIHNSRHNE